jgi:NADPH-dependent 2,4-dienoyl-CoA reductase/sulfur reductase-like enzyme
VYTNRCCGSSGSGSGGTGGRGPEAADRVIVIGAGVAGLTIGNALTTAGVDTVVLEARDRSQVVSPRLPVRLQERLARRRRTCT